MIQGVAAFPGMKDIQDQLERIFLVSSLQNASEVPKAITGPGDTQIDKTSFLSSKRKKKKLLFQRENQKSKAKLINQ